LFSDFTAAFGTAGAGFGTGAAELPGLSAGLFSSELELLELSLDEGSSLTTVFGCDAGKAATFPSFSFFLPDVALEAAATLFFSLLRGRDARVSRAAFFFSLLRERDVRVARVPVLAAFFSSLPREREARVPRA